MIAFDVETTGKNADTDQIVEISMCLYEAGSERGYHRLIRPDVPIASGAQKVHGITMEDLKDAPSFAEVADEIYDFLDAADVIVGYNVRFDIRFVEKEFDRIGRTVTLYEKLVVDPYRIWQAMEPRSLEDAHVRFVGSKMENAHSAEADVQAAVRVLRGVRETFNLQEASWEDLAIITTPELRCWIGPTDHVKWEDGRVVLGFGKHNGKPVYDVVRDAKDYLRWITGADFPPHVKSLCKGAMSGIPEEAFVERIIQFYGPPPPPEE
jgi:DNA polymerase III subunit epsilon